MTPGRRLTGNPSSLRHLAGRLDYHGVLKFSVQMDY